LGNSGTVEDDAFVLVAGDPTIVVEVMVLVTVTVAVVVGDAVAVVLGPLRAAK